jgi:hypothetical protein
LARGEKPGQIAQAMDVSRKIVYRDLKEIAMQPGTGRSFWCTARRSSTTSRKLRDRLEDGLIPPDKKVALALDILDREMKMVGTASPERAIQVVRQNTHVKHTVEFVRPGTVPGIGPEG